MPSIIQRIRAILKPSIVQISLGSDAPTQVLNYTAKKLYQTQENLQAVVNFLSNSIAQLPLKVYIREGEDSRKRDRSSAAAMLLYRPNEYQTAFEFIRGMVMEYFVFGCVYVWVIPDADAPSGWQLLIIPSDWVNGTVGGSVYAPEAIRVAALGGSIDIPKSEYVPFKTYSPGNPAGYISPISGLRQTLTEQIEAGRFRKELWHSSGRLNAQITRPKDVMPWDEETRKKFVTAFREAWGEGGSKAGSIPLLEDGMEIKPFQTSFKEQQWAESIKLSRESVAAAYGVNPSLIWHTDTQTYASSKDNARALYAECLGPVLQMIQQRINSFLLPMIGADPNTYVEFDLGEKLKGSFEERASILQSATGGPWMTRNEARADNNLPPIDGGDEMIVPLNVIEGGQASPTDTHMDEQKMAVLRRGGCGCRHQKSEQIRIKSKSSDEENEAVAEILSKFFKRQADSVLPKLGAKSAKWWDEDRWNEELADDLEPAIDEIADAHGIEVAKVLGFEYGTAQTRKYLRALTEGRAKAINKATYDKLLDAIDSKDEDQTPAHVFEEREGEQAALLGRSLALAAAMWAANREAPQQAEEHGIHKTVEKVWVTGDNPRPSHQLMDGETVPVNETFSNGAYWPGDDNLDPDESCGCNCSTEIIVTY